VLEYNRWEYVDFPEMGAPRRLKSGADRFALNGPPAARRDFRPTARAPSPRGLWEAPETLVIKTNIRRSEKAKKPPKPEGKLKRLAGHGIGNSNYIMPCLLTKQPIYDG
jgi:hypothetical protein